MSAVWERESFSRADILRASEEGQVLQIQTSALFDAKNFENMVCPHGQGERRVEPMQTFSGKGCVRCVKFSQFCADIFYGQLLNRVIDVITE